MEFLFSKTKKEKKEKNYGKMIILLNLFKLNKMNISKSLTNRFTNQCNYNRKQTETKYKHWCLINFFNGIKPRFIKGPVAQLVRAVHS